MKKSLKKERIFDFRGARKLGECKSHTCFMMLEMEGGKTLNDSSLVGILPATLSRFHLDGPAPA